MAPPIPGLRGPAIQPRSQRTPADVVLGILAVLALAALTVGIPAGLALAFGLPVPRHLSLSALTTQLDVGTILKVLAIIVWLAWLQLLWCVVVEIRAAIRNVGVPARVPMAGPTQSLAHRLVTAALLLFSAAAALSPALPGHMTGPAQPAHSISVSAQGPWQSSPTAGQSLAGQQGGSQSGGSQATATQQATAQDTGQKIYVVRPPAGRYHESLWEIAHNHLGDGRRYREIFELNSGHVQPDGTRLTIASLIRPGWVLRMPADATGPGIETVAQHLAHDRPAHEVHGPQHDGLTDGIPGTAHASPATTVVQPAGGGQASGSVQHGTGSGGSWEWGRSVNSAAWPNELAAAGLLAAGVLAALGRRRRERLWVRAFGQRLAAPEGDAALAEQALRFGADDPATHLLDVSLRHLARSLATSGRVPPTVFAAHLAADHLDLWVAPPDEDPPAPWTAGDGGQLWRLPSGTASSLDPGDALAPYPGLITLGTNHTGRIMVDLEAAHGLIALRGPAETVRAALAAMAVELVTNCWSDRMRVTLVGFGSEITPLYPERTVVAPSLADALSDLENRAGALAGALSITGFDSVLTGRARTSDPDVWAPHYLIVGAAPSPEEERRLLALARTRHRTAVGIVVAGDIAGATWTWDLSADGRLQAGVLGFDVAAQLLPEAQYAAVAALFASADGDPPLSDPSVGAAPAAHLAPGARFPVEVGILGPVTIQAPGPLEADRMALSTEIVAFLAAHPGGVHVNVLSAAVWPRGVPAEVRDAALGRVAAWLGTDPSGRPGLATDSAGRLSLGDGVRVDWPVFRALVARAISGEDEADGLEHALSLVRGQALDGAGGSLAGGEYGWLATDDFRYEVTALVADCAHRLATLRLAAGDAGGAMAAARSGLRLAFDDEELWRDLLRAAHGSGQERVLRSVVDEICARAALDEVMPRMAAQTEALIDELLPSWRSPAA